MIMSGLLRCSGARSKGSGRWSVASQSATLGWLAKLGDRLGFGLLRPPGPADSRLRHVPDNLDRARSLGGIKIVRVGWEGVSRLPWLRAVRSSALLRESKWDGALHAESASGLSFAPPGLTLVSLDLPTALTHGLRRGLHSFAASRLAGSLRLRSGQARPALHMKSRVNGLD
jgi:hypothetical protein